ncbi:hypothetical protein NPIL_453321 [Nephila pilipes]|uniref:Uncharacterized protein n=1 Tax=Nephila pilipes TaxID=299642 RepID=A0A8X6MMP7_NEPPI|nr:hypothetical protein NPIL_665041 [Nephila pilipes]GFU23414.1 hypothetical protein NPIL_453321 [Nephila pilipes]
MKRVPSNPSPISTIENMHTGPIPDPAFLDNPPQITLIDVYLDNFIGEKEAAGTDCVPQPISSSLRPCVLQCFITPKG